MKSIKVFMLTLAAAATAFAAPATAEEGMFVLPELKGALPWNQLKKVGLELDAKGIQRLAPAIAKVAHGGTGSFVSPQGLLVTNHHVAYMCLAALSAQKEHWGLLDKGYYAKTQNDELPCPGYDLQVVVETKDVTADVVKAGAKQRKLKKRLEAKRLEAAKIAAKCMKDTGDFCTVKSYGGGLKWYLNRYKNIRDVRLVYAPPKSMGFFGGDTDNWRYPRHTPDFSFLRAYVGKDGKPAPYAKDNVPFRPAAYLKVSTEGVNKGRIVMVLGFPGRTMRFYTSPDVEFYVKHQAPLKKELFGKLLKVVEKAMDIDAVSKARYASMRNMLANAAKYYADSLKKAQEAKLLEHKLKDEAALKARLPKDKQADFDRKLNEIKKIYEKTIKVYPGFYDVAIMTYVVPGMRAAYYLARWNRVKKISSIKRKDDLFKDKNLYRVKGYLDKLELKAWPRADKEVMYFLLSRLSKDDPKSPVLRYLGKMVKRQMRAMRKKAKARMMSLQDYYRYTLAAPYTKDPLRQAIDILYGRTSIVAWSTSEEEAARARRIRKAYYELKAGKLRKVADPLIQFAVFVDKYIYDMEEKQLWDQAYRIPFNLRPDFVKEFLHPAYYDANFTLRLTYGLVKDYTSSENGKTYPYLTGLKGMLAKYDAHHGKGEFSLPVSFLNVARKPYSGRWVDKNIGDVPLDFTATLDTTGGNSGSPVIDGKGRLVGLLFDGTPESILSDWYYNTQQRSICFDIRFTFYMMEEWTHADRLLHELGLK